jgi:hypothetical protein
MKPSYLRNVRYTLAFIYDQTVRSLEAGLLLKRESHGPGIYQIRKGGSFFFFFNS